MNNILKKFSVIALLFVFVSFSGVIVGASEGNLNTQVTEIESTDGNVVLPEEEYNDLIKRIEELEQLKSDEIDDNLIEFYEKSNSQTSDSIGIIVGFTAVAIGAAAILIGILAVVNYKSSEKTIDEAKQAVNDAKEANKVIDKVSEKLEITDNNLKEYDDKLADLNKEMNEIVNMKNRLNISMKKSIAKATTDLNTKIEIYNDIIEDEYFDIIQDIQIYIDRGNTYFLMATKDFKYMNKATSYFEKRKNNLELFDITSYNQLILNAIHDLNFAIKFNTDNEIDDINDNIITTCKIKLATCLILIKEIDESVSVCKNITMEAEGLDELVDYLSTFIIFNRRSDILFSVSENKFVIDKLYKHLFFKKKELLYVVFSHKYLKFQFKSPHSTESRYNEIFEVIKSELDNMFMFIKKLNRTENGYEYNIEVDELISVLKKCRNLTDSLQLYTQDVVSYDVGQSIYRFSEEQFQQLIDKVKEFEHIEPNTGELNEQQHKTTN